MTGDDLMDLKRYAHEATATRGHDLGAWADLTPTTALAACKACQKEVIVNTAPEPNDICAGGPAMGLNCPGAPRQVGFSG